jgi:hypothetical protein
MILNVLKEKADNIVASIGRSVIFHSSDIAWAFGFRDRIRGVEMVECVYKHEQGFYILGWCEADDLVKSEQF